MGAEQLALDLYRGALADPTTPPRGGAVGLAIRLHGRDVIYRQPRASTEATVARVGGARRIVIRKETSPRRANFLVGKMLARMAGAANDEEETAAAAWLVAPPVPFAAHYEQVGLNLGALADAFAITWTCATMRIPEVGGPGAAVITPERVYGRGSLAWLQDEDVRRIAAQARPRSVRKVTIRDEPGRLALVAYRR